MSPLSAPDPDAERLLVIGLAGDLRGRSVASLHRTFTELSPARLDRTIASLCAVGVLQRGGAGLIQAPALARIDVLEVICV